MTPVNAEADTERAAEINRAYYAKMAPGQDDYWNRMAAPRFRVKTILRLVQEAAPARLADLGCGNGRLLAEIAKRHSRIQLAGVDLSLPQIEANRQRQPHAEWYCLNLDTSIAQPSEAVSRFDVVVASEIIEHLDHPDIFLRNARALAVPGRGQLILSTQSGPIGETERRVGHRRHFERDEMVSLLDAAGWKPLRVWNCGYPFHDLSKWYANRNADASMRRFGAGAYGPREKLVCYALRAAFLLNSQQRGMQLFALARLPEQA